MLGVGGEWTPNTKKKKTKWLVQTIPPATIYDITHRSSSGGSSDMAFGDSGRVSLIEIVVRPESVGGENRQFRKQKKTKTKQKKKQPKPKSRVELNGNKVIHKRNPQTVVVHRAILITYNGLKRWQCNSSWNLKWDIQYHIVNLYCLLSNISQYIDIPKYDIDMTY